MKHLFNLTKLLVLVLLITSCSTEEDEPTPTVDESATFTDYQLEVEEYFKEIAMGFEFGEATQITRKWIEPMRVFVGGKPTEVHLTELDRVINEINELSTDGFEISLVEDSLASNYYVFFGSHKAYQWMYPLLTDLIENNVGLFGLDWDDNHNLHSGHMYVDTERVDVTAQLHIIREELTQSIGLGRDSYKYSLSIFQQRWSTVTEYTELDRDLIRVLYHPKMTTGYNETNVSRVLIEIFEKLEIE